jgi:hypothetical protein
MRFQPAGLIRSNRGAVIAPVARIGLLRTIGAVSGRELKRDRAAAIEMKSSCQATVIGRRKGPSIKAQREKCDAGHRWRMVAVFRSAKLFEPVRNLLHRSSVSPRQFFTSIAQPPLERL